MELLADHLSEGKRALDVGSGSGYLTACMALMVRLNYKSSHLCIKSAYLKKFFVNTVKFPVFVGVSFSLGECYATLYECAVGAICKIDILLKILDELNCFRKIILNFNH